MGIVPAPQVPTNRPHQTQHEALIFKIKPSISEASAL
jgi:hypothetical protein